MRGRVICCYCCCCCCCCSEHRSSFGTSVTLFYHPSSSSSSSLSSFTHAWFLYFFQTLNETWNESWIIVGSLYGQPRVARHGNYAEINFCGWKNLWELPRTKCTQFPDREIILYFFSFPGNYVQIVRGISHKFFPGRKFISALFPCLATRGLPYKLDKMMHDLCTSVLLVK